MKIHFLIILFFTVTAHQVNAQNSIVTSGGNAKGTSGSVDYSIGQVAYKHVSAASGSVNIGVQQPFEVIVLGVDHFPTIVLEMSLFPNPATEYVILKIEDLKTDNLICRLMDVFGKQISETKISKSETQLFLDNLNTASYILNIIRNDQIIKSFSIIKN